MPQFNAYPIVTDFSASDIFLVFRSSTASVKTIIGSDLVASIKNLTSKSLVISVIAATTTLTTQQFVVFNSGAPFTVNLPLSTFSAGTPYYLSNKGAGTVTIAPAGGDTIAGAASLAIPQYSSHILIPDGLGMWHKY